MIPWLKVLPQRDIILAPFRTNQTIGLLLLSRLFRILPPNREASRWRLGSPVARHSTSVCHL
jgi:hypothetical protein